MKKWQKVALAVGAAIFFISAATTPLGAGLIRLASLLLRLLAAL
jgi:hypothetical protein